MRLLSFNTGFVLCLSLCAGCGAKEDGSDSTSTGDTGSFDTGTPVGEEICDGEDNDGDGRVDEGFADTDEDGIPDCLDEEECDDLDNDGDGAIDEGFDLDMDGVADCLEVEDCNGLDDDADGEVDEDFDLDGDGYTTCGTFPDCDDTDPDISPGCAELDGDLTDNDCDGLVDETSWRPGDLVITEIMVAPLAVADTRGEWIEVANTSDRPVVLNGLRVFSGTGSHLIMRSEWVIIEAGEVAVLGLSMNPSQNGGVSVDYAYSGINLDPGEDTLTLAAEGLILDAVAWGSSLPVSEGASLSLDPSRWSGAENDVPESWCTAVFAWAEATDLGSPGSENSLCGQLDHDGDGWSADAGDCDDEDAGSYPGAPEIDAGVDNDCDGVLASQPVAWADYDLSSSLSSCDVLQLDGSGSYDPDGDPLSYAWTLLSVPEGSAADGSWIISDTDVQPTFSTDLPGDYRFSLTVSDGVLSSLASNLTLTLTDPAITYLDAGPDQTQATSTSCSSTSCDECPAVVFALSTDAGEHASVMGFEWSVATDWVDIGIDDSSSASPYVVVWGVEPEPGETVEQVLEIDLTASDCLDREAVDTVVLTVSCTGS